jgi:hypothetical protein
MAAARFLFFVFVAVTTVAATAMLARVRGTSDGPGAFLFMFRAAGGWMLGWMLILAVLASKLRAALRERGPLDRIADLRDLVVDGAGKGATPLERLVVHGWRFVLAVLAGGLAFQLFRAVFSRTVVG